MNYFDFLVWCSLINCLSSTKIASSAKVGFGSYDNRNVRKSHKNSWVVDLNISYHRTKVKSSGNIRSWVMTSGMCQKSSKTVIIRISSYFPTWFSSVWMFLAIWIVWKSQKSVSQSNKGSWVASLGEVEQFLTVQRLQKSEKN